MKKFKDIKDTIDMVVGKKEILSVQEFLQINKTKPGALKSAEFIAPKIGSKGFGTFQVEYRIPRLLAEHE